ICCVAKWETRPRRLCDVNGVLLIGEMPATKASLAFHPLTGIGRVRPVAITREDGSYRLTTYAHNDGAPEGDYGVTVVWPDDSIPFDECEGHDPAIHDRLRGFYASPTSTTLRATVRSGANRIDLRTQDVERVLEEWESRSSP